MKWIGQVVHGVKTNFSNDGEIYVIADDLYIENVTQDKDIIFKTNDGGTATEVMRIDGSTSNVGIGTTSPTEKLEVVGDIKLATSNASYYLKIENNLSYANPFNLISAFGLEVLSVNSGHISTATNGGANFGIGTTSPTEKLHVVGDSLVTGDNQADTFKPAAIGEPIKFKNFASTELVRITDAGNVGIGTTNPARTLDVAGRGRFIDTNSTVDILSSNYIPLLITNTNGYAHARINGFEVGGNTSATNEGYIKTSDNSRKLFLDTNGWRFLENNNELLRITSAGNVGIGTTSPTTKLDVVGTGKFSEKLTISDNQYLSWSSNSRIVANSSYMQFQVAATDKMRILADGNVGIGTTSPSSILEVGNNSGFFSCTGVRRWLC